MTSLILGSQELKKSTSLLKSPALSKINIMEVVNKGFSTNANAKINL